MASAEETAKQELFECEKEISAIKSTVRLLGPASADSDPAPNQLSVVVLKVEGLPETAVPKLTLQLSSPIEEVTLTDLFDPSLEAGNVPETMKATFESVEAAQATLTVTVQDADIPLGSSEPLDLGSKATKFDAMLEQKEYQSEVVVPINADGAAEGDAAVCSVTLRTTFVPSVLEKREQLYELLGVATKKKSEVVEKLRRSVMQTMPSRQQQQQMTKPGAKPAVKAGFLNKAPKKEVSKWQAWYNMYLGPESLVRRGFPVAKNYLIFFGAVALCHFKGHALALPPPV